MDTGTLALVLGGIGFALIVLAVLAVVGRAEWRRRRPRADGPPLRGAAGHRHVWAEAGRKAGLELAPDPGDATVALVGQDQGAQVRVEVRCPPGVEPDVWAKLTAGGPVPEAADLRVRVQARRAAPMPAGLRVEAKQRRRSGRGYGGGGTGDARLDEALAVTGDDRALVRALVSDAAVYSALLALVQAERPFTWTPGTAAVDLEPATLPRFQPVHALSATHQLAALVIAAARRQARPWEALGKRLGLDGLTGTVDGVGITLEAGFDTGQAVLSVGDDLGGLALRAGADPGGAGKPVKMPSDDLARALQGRARDLYLARRLLSASGLAAALVDVVGGGARLAGGVLRLDLTPDEAAEATLRAAIGLAARLRKGAKKARR